MGDFDENIAWLKERRAAALEEIREIEAGVRYIINGTDRTEKHRKRAQDDAARLEVLIAAYEAHNANRT